MKDLIKIDQTIWDVVENPEKYEIEICATSLDVLKNVGKQLYNLQKNVEIRIMEEMIKDDATKLNFMDVAGESKVLTLKPGPMKQTVDNAEDVIKDNDFDPNQLGDYQYKLFPWSKMKEMQKLGGAVKDLIDKLYVRGKRSLSIGDK